MTAVENSNEPSNCHKRFKTTKYRYNFITGAIFLFYLKAVKWFYKNVKRNISTMAVYLDITRVSNKPKQATVGKQICLWEVT